jgi:hypothetical protein
MPAGAKKGILIRRAKPSAALQANTPKRLTNQFVPLALAPTKLVQEILEVIRRRSFVAFQPKQVRDVIVANRVHASAKVFGRETNFIWPR